MSGGNTATYRPFLDGLRAVAVYLVVLYHSGLGVFRHGFIGVDIFFVLSGYLVTQLLLRDLAANGGIRLRRFYARRYRRLLPASFVVLITTAVVFTVIATAAEVAEATDAFRAAFLYVANWYFIHQAADPPGSSPECDAWLEQTALESLGRLEGPERKLLVFEPIP